MSEEKPEYGTRLSINVEPEALNAEIARDLMLLRQTIGLPLWINSLTDEQYEVVNELVAVWLTHPRGLLI